MDEQNYPSNSFKNKGQEERRAVNVVGGGIIKKKSTGKQVLDSFVNNDSKTIGSHILFDIVVPTIKDMLFTGFNSALDMLLYGDDTHNYNSHGRRIVSNGQTNYNAISQKRRIAPSEKVNIGDDVGWTDRYKAKEALNELTDILDTYAYVRVYDFYEIAGLSCDPALRGWGWYDLTSAKVIDNLDGTYSIAMPKPVSLKN